MPIPPSTPSDAACDVANRLFARETHGAADEVALIRAAERICDNVLNGLSRWFGPYGSMALFTRALVRARANYPSLAALTTASGQSPCLIGLDEAARTHGAKAVADGVVAMLATLVDAIGRLIGDDLATSVFEQSTTVQPSSSPVRGPGADRTYHLPSAANTPVDEHQTMKKP